MFVKTLAYNPFINKYKFKQFHLHGCKLDPLNSIDCMKIIRWCNSESENQGFLSIDVVAVLTDDSIITYDYIKPVDEELIPDDKWTYNEDLENYSIDFCRFKGIGLNSLYYD